MSTYRANRYNILKTIDIIKIIIILRIIWHGGLSKKNIHPKQFFHAGPTSHIATDTSPSIIGGSFQLPGDNLG
jgi:hypothetical protein